MVYVLKGWMRTQFEGVGERTLEAGDCMYQEPGIRHRVLDYSDDLEVLEITVPAEFEIFATVGFEEDHRTSELTLRLDPSL